MKREILFRGKSVVGNVWIYGGYFKHTPDEEGLQYLIFESSNGAIEVIPETVSQFTGLTDKNGVKIFEGDIINVPYNNIGNSVVKYLINELRYNISNYDLSKIDVIGNIHDA